MGRPDWSRRDLLKTVGTGVLGLGVGAAVYKQMTPYIIGTNSPDGSAAAASLSETDHEQIDLSEHTPLTLVCGIFSKSRSQSLLSREDVAFAQPDRTLSHVADSNGSDASAGDKTLPWGIDRIDADVAHAQGATGSGVDVAVIDGGIDAAHDDLRSNIADPDVDENHESWEECSGDHCRQPWYDDGGHGTHVAGTIAADRGDTGIVGVAPGATLHALKVCSAGGGCRTSAIVEAIRYAAENGWDVLNLSLGSPRESPALKTAGEYAIEAGVVPVAAAGNRGSPDSVGYPAAYDEFVAVSATTIDDGIADFSSRGPEVDIAAPGDEVCSADLGGYAVRNGTSMASPHVAGTTAQLLANGFSPSEARQRLIDTAEDIGLAESEQGAGLVDVAAALGFDSDDDGIGDGIDCPT